MKVLGVDPGTYVCGYGLIESDGNEIKFLDSGFIGQPRNLSLPLRLKNIFDKLNTIINIYNPDEMSIEDVFVSKNPRSTLKLGEARGVAILAASVSNIPVYEYSPTEVKASVTGNGRSSKLDVMKMISSILNIKKSMRSDTSDALAIAICHIHNSALQKKYGFKIRKKSARKKRFSIDDIPAQR